MTCMLIIGLVHWCMSILWRLIRMIRIFMNSICVSNFMQFELLHMLTVSLFTMKACEYAVCKTKVAQSAACCKTNVLFNCDNAYLWQTSWYTFVLQIFILFSSKEFCYTFCLVNKMVKSYMCALIWQLNYSTIQQRTLCVL